MLIFAIIKITDMKNYLLLIAFLSVLLVSCGKEKKVDNSTKSVFETISERHCFKINFADSSYYEGLNWEPYSEIKMHILWPEMLLGKTPEPLQKEILAMAFSDTISNVASGIRSVLSTPIFYDDIEGVSQTEVDSIPQDFSSYLFIDVAPVHMDSKVISYEVNSSSYVMSAAHGMYSSQYTSYDLEKGKVIELSDLFVDKNKLLPIIKGQIEEQYGTKDNCIDYDKIEVSDNFYIDGNVLVFCYNPYDIACYAQGIVKAEVPFFNLLGANNITAYGQKLLSLCE